MLLTHIRGSVTISLIPRSNVGVFSKCLDLKTKYQVFKLADMPPILQLGEEEEDKAFQTLYVLGIIEKFLRCTFSKGMDVSFPSEIR